MASIKSFLQGAFPFISAGLSSVNPVVGSLASNFLGKALGIANPNPSMDELDAAMAKVTPDQLPALIAQIRNGDNEFKVQMASLGYKSETDLAAIDAGERDSARKREMAVKDKTPEFLAFAFVTGYFFMFWYFMHFGVRSDLHDIMITMLGVMASSVGAIVGYYFGASRSQNAVSQQLAQNANSLTKP